MTCEICRERKRIKKMLEIDCEDVTNSQTGWNEREYRKTEYIKKLKEICPKCYEGVDGHNILSSSVTTPINVPMKHKHRCSCGWESEEFDGRFVESDLTDWGRYVFKPRKWGGVTLVFKKEDKYGNFLIPLDPTKEKLHNQEGEDDGISDTWGKVRD